MRYAASVKLAFVWCRAAAPSHCFGEPEEVDLAFRSVFSITTVL